jgi:hypothetical protein
MQPESMASIEGAVLPCAQPFGLHFPDHHGRGVHAQEEGEQRCGHAPSADLSTFRMIMHKDPGSWHCGVVSMNTASSCTHGSMSWSN